MAVELTVQYVVVYVCRQSAFLHIFISVFARKLSTYAISFKWNFIFCLCTNVHCLKVFHIYIHSFTLSFRDAISLIVTRFLSTFLGSWFSSLNRCILVGLMQIFNIGDDLLMTRCRFKQSTMASLCTYLLTSLFLLILFQSIVTCHRCINIHFERPLITAEHVCNVPVCLPPDENIIHILHFEMNAKLNCRSS